MVSSSVNLSSMSYALLNVLPDIRSQLGFGKTQQNGVAVCINRTLLERARCMLSNAHLWHRRDFWAEAISTACYLVNRSPHSSIEFKIPEEVWSGNHVDYPF